MSNAERFPTRSCIWREISGKCNLLTSGDVSLLLLLINLSTRASHVRVVAQTPYCEAKSAAMHCNGDKVFIEGKCGVILASLNIFPAVGMGGIGRQDVLHLNWMIHRVRGSWWAPRICEKKTRYSRETFPHCSERFRWDSPALLFFTLT